MHIPETSLRMTRRNSAGTKDHLILARQPDLMISNQKKKITCRIVDFHVPAYHSVKFKENEKQDKYVDLAWEQKTLGNIKVTVIPVAIGALGTVPK